MSHVPSRPKKAESELLLSTIEDFHMDQLNTEPTRGTNILELILSLVRFFIFCVIFS